MNFMKELNTITVNLDTEELMNLIEYSNERASNIPTQWYNNPTIGGCTFGELAQKYKDRSNELYELLNKVYLKNNK